MTLKSEDRTNEFVSELAATQKRAQLGKAEAVLWPVSLILAIVVFGLSFWWLELGLLLSVVAAVITIPTIGLCVGLPLGYFLGNRAAKHIREIAENPNNISADTAKALAAPFINRGKMFAERGQYDRAFSEFHKAAIIDPNDTDAFYNRGLVYLIEHQYDSAIADFNEAIRLDPKNADAFNNRGSAHYYSGQRDQAIADFDEAIRLNPNHIDAINNRRSISGGS